LCQQITNNLPDKFGSSDEDEDEEEGNWIGEYGADNATNGLGPFGNDHAPDFDSDEDDDAVDEETWNNPVSFWLYCEEILYRYCISLTCRLFIHQYTVASHIGRVKNA
jgi:hypothetical protein